MLGRKRRRAGLIVLAWLAGLGPTLAAEGDCIDYGELGAGPGPILGTVKAGEARVPFVQGASQRKGCPGSDPGCREKGFLVPGDTVILGAMVPGFVCATYVGRKGALRSGWLSDDAIARAPEPPAPTLRDWTGTWTAPEATLVIRLASNGGSSKAAGALSVKGDASYGTLDPDRVRRGAINMGSVEGTVAPNGPTLGFTMGDKGTVPYTAGDSTACRLRLRLLPPFLLAEDNASCGGMNVSFTNVYRRSTS